MIPSPSRPRSKPRGRLDRRAKRRERSIAVYLVRLWRTRYPQTFTEKVRYKMLRDHRSLLAVFADKAAVRDYVAAAVGADYLPAVYAIAASPEELLPLDLPESYVVKPTHGSGAAIVVSPTAPVDARLPEPRWGWVYAVVRPKAADRAVLVDFARSWSSKLYGQGPNREWAYGRVPPRTIVEKMLVGHDGGIPDDYKFFVFNGRCRYIQVDSGRFGRRTQDFYDVTWRHLALSGGHPWAEPERLRPPELDEMLRVAEALGAETDFVRVDLYLLPDRIVFGELTSYPAGGNSPFEPVEFDAAFGAAWTVPRRYR